MHNVILPVRVNRTHAPRGISRSEATVQCPVTCSAQPLATCESCPRKLSIVSSATAPASITCAVPDEAACFPPRDFAAHAQALLATTWVADVMTQDVSCVTPNLSLEALTQLFDDRRISAAPVLDAVGALIGMVTKTDVLRETYDFDEHPPRAVAEVMTVRPVTIQETSPLAQALAMLLPGTVHHLPVVSATGQLVGILSSHDIIRWLALK